MKNKKFYLLFVILFFIGISLFSALGDINLYDWDEANFAELAREMILTDNYLQPQINYLPFYEKPPLFIWMQVLSMKMFGIGEFAARFPNACLGLIVALTLYFIGKREKDSKFAFIWMMTYMGSFLPFMYFRTGLIDPWFNYFMFLSLYFYYNSVKNTSHKFISIVISSLMLGLAVQTKGPVALIIVCGSLGIMWILSKFRFFLGILRSLSWILLSLAFSSVWFYLETKAHGENYIKEFFDYQIRLFTTEDATHGGPFYYHFIVLLIGCFPASFILFFKTDWKKSWKEDWFKIMCICGVLVLVLFSIVQTKIIHYSSMAYFPISYIAAIAIYNGRFRFEKSLHRILITTILILIAALFIFPILGKNVHSILPFINDLQTRLQLQAVVIWRYWESLYGFVVLGVFIWLKNKYKGSYSPYFISTTFIVLIMLLFFAPKIERYTQGTYIDFCKSKKGQDVYIQPLFMKSYASLFYSAKQPFLNDVKRDHAWMYDGDVDKTVFFISVTKDSLQTYYRRPYINLIDSKSGYDFFVRKKSSD